MLYKDSLESYHASYCVQIIDESAQNKNTQWTNWMGSDRITEAAAKVREKYLIDFSKCA